MEEALKTIISSLVNDVDAVSISQREEEGFTVFEVKVAEGDMGKVIGKEGRIAKAIRTIMKAISSKENKKISIEFIG